MTFNIQGEIRSLRGTLALVCADNPAAHLLGGFKSLTSALCRCRVCLATNDDVQAKVHVHVHVCKICGIASKLFCPVYS